MLDESVQHPKDIVGIGTFFAGEIEANDTCSQGDCVFGFQRVMIVFCSLGCQRHVQVRWREAVGGDQVLKMHRKGPCLFVYHQSCSSSSRR